MCTRGVHFAFLIQGTERHVCRAGHASCSENFASCLEARLAASGCSHMSTLMRRHFLPAYCSASWSLPYYSKRTLPISARRDEAPLGAGVDFASRNLRILLSETDFFRLSESVAVASELSGF